MANDDKIERVIVALTALALNAPSTYTIAWSKGQHPDELPILYAGIATSGVTVLGAVLGKRYFGTEIMWGGLLGTLALFAYVAFMYKPSSTSSSDSASMASVLPAIAITNDNMPPHFMV